MVTQRTQGLYRVFLLCQIAIVAALFWFGVWVMVTFYSPGAELTWRRYSIYCAMLFIGMLGESLSREGSKKYFLQSELLLQHRLALRQTIASVGVLVIYLVATKDSFISRLFFFNFLPWLYSALLFSQSSPGFSPNFSLGRKTLLVGRARAAQLRGWAAAQGRAGANGGPHFEEPLEYTHRIPARRPGVLPKRDPELMGDEYPLEFPSRTKTATSSRPATAPAAALIVSDLRKTAPFGDPFR
jgi:hypothetical protein